MKRVVKSSTSSLKHMSNRDRAMLEDLLCEFNDNDLTLAHRYLQREGMDEGVRAIEDVFEAVDTILDYLRDHDEEAEY